MIPEINLTELRQDIDLFDAIPGQFRLATPDRGVILRREYSCFHYTDLHDLGVDIQARCEGEGYALERRKNPLIKRCNIYLPPGYTGAEQYPVVYVLHGLTNGEDAWLEYADPHPGVLLDNLIARELIRPCIAVFPNGNSGSLLLDRSFENQAGYYFFGNELAHDLIPYIESEFSARTDRRARAICGFSMGGMQTINIGLCQCLKYYAWFGAFAAAPTTYPSSRIAECLEDENTGGSYPVGFFYNLCGFSDTVAGVSHESAILSLLEKTEYLNASNFMSQVIPGGHEYSAVLPGLVNFLQICSRLGWGKKI